MFPGLNAFQVKPRNDPILGEAEVKCGSRWSGIIPYLLLNDWRVLGASVIYIFRAGSGTYWGCKQIFNFSHGIKGFCLWESNLRIHNPLEVMPDFSLSHGRLSHF